MARQAKTKWVSARVDDATDMRFTTYLEATELNMGELIRQAVDEYIINHPVKPPRESDTLPSGIKQLAGKD